jgi:hypothetical protein
MFWENLPVPHSRAKKSKKRGQVKLTDIMFFFRTCPSPNFLKKHKVSETGSVSVFKAKKHLNWYTP